MKYKNRLIRGDCLKIMQSFPKNSVNLVFGSPPYENARDLISDPFPVLVGEAWVSWMVKVYIESLRICKGLVAFVIQGRTRNFSWSGTPVLLAADLIRQGITIRDFIIYHRVGIPGSGGPDWLRHDCEYILCATNGGKLPWSDNTAMGHKPVCPVGGKGTYRISDGRRNPNPHYIHPKKANPGNLIKCGAVGGGHLGSKLAHESEAPFPESLADFIIRSFCRPNGIVLDPFAGSFTTCAVAKKLKRRYIGIDIRASQISLGRRRLAEI